MGAGDDARARSPMSAAKAFEVDHAASVHGHDLDDRAGLPGDQLPGHDVGVVFERGEQDLVAGPAGAAAQYDCATRLIDSVVPRVKMTSRVDAAFTKVAHSLARCSNSLGRFLAQLVHAAMHVGVVAASRSCRPRRSRSAGAATRRRCRGTPAVCRAPRASRIGKSRPTRRVVGARCWSALQRSHRSSSQAGGRSRAVAPTPFFDLVAAHGDGTICDHRLDERPLQQCLRVARRRCRATAGRTASARRVCRWSRRARRTRPCRSRVAGAPPLRRRCR